METINNRGICLLNAPMQEAQLENQDLRLLYFLEWKHKHPVAYGILNAALEDSVIFYLIDKYLTAILKQADTSTSADKNILKSFADLDLLGVLMDKKSVEEKYAALLKWEKSILKIIVNDLPEVLTLGRISGATKTRIDENPKIKAYKQQKVILDYGRIKGQQKQKEYAKDTKDLIYSINSDLLKHADTARWILKARAKYIAEKLVLAGREQINGKPYMVSTIRLFITGT